MTMETSNIVQTTESTEVPLPLGNLQSLDVTILHSAIGIAMCFLNAICAAAIIRGKLHEEENRFMFMGSLAVVDSIFGFTLVLTATLNQCQTNSIVNFASNIAHEAVLAADPLCLCLMTADQFMRIELHMRYPVYASFRNACFALTGVLFLCSAQVVVVSFVWYYSGEETFNYLLLPRWYHIYNIVVYFLVPLLLIVSIHMRIFYISWIQMKKVAHLAPMMSVGSKCCLRSCDMGCKHHDASVTTSRSINNFEVSTVHIPPPRGSVQQSKKHNTSAGQAVRPQGHNHSLKARKQWNAVITISVLVGVLLCSWVPPYLVANLFVFYPSLTVTSTVLGKIFDFISTMYLINSLINPFIYIARVPEVKRQIKKMIRCPFRHQ